MHTERRTSRNIHTPLTEHKKEQLGKEEVEEKKKRVTLCISARLPLSAHVPIQSYEGLVSGGGETPPEKRPASGVHSAVPQNAFARSMWRPSNPRLCQFEQEPVRRLPVWARALVLRL